MWLEIHGDALLNVTNKPAGLVLRLDFDGTRIREAELTVGSSTMGLENRAAWDMLGGETPENRAELAALREAKLSDPDAEVDAAIEAAEWNSPIAS